MDNTIIYRYIALGLAVIFFSFGCFSYGLYLGYNHNNSTYTPPSPHSDAVIVGLEVIPLAHDTCDVILSLKLDNVQQVKIIGANSFNQNYSYVLTSSRYTEINMSQYHEYAWSAEYLDYYTVYIVSAGNALIGLFSIRIYKNLQLQIGRPSIYCESLLDPNGEYGGPYFNDAV